jgi:hypothetical protein
METYELNLDHPEKNEGVWAQKGINFKVNNSLYNAVIIQKTFPDATDYIKSRISASLLPDGSGVVITEPSAAACMIYDVEKAYKKDDLERDPIFSKVYLAHVTSALKIQTEPERQVKRTTYLFPNKIRCKMGVFNKNSGLKLSTRVRPSQGAKLVSNNSVLQTLTYRCIWIIAIDEEERLTASEPNADEDLIEACKGMSFSE